MLNMDMKLAKREEEGKIIRTGIVGAGQMGRGMVTQMVLMKGIMPAIVSDIKFENVINAFHYAGVKDEDILNAIRYHTTGRPGMSLLEKIIFVADYIEPGRDSAPNLPQVRSLAFESIDDCVLQILKDTLIYLGTTGAEVDPMTQITYEYYRRCDEERKFYE